MMSEIDPMMSAGGPEYSEWFESRTNRLGRVSQKKTILTDGEMNIALRKRIGGSVKLAIP